MTLPGAPYGTTEPLSQSQSSTSTVLAAIDWSPEANVLLIGTQLDQHVNYLRGRVASVLEVAEAPSDTTAEWDVIVALAGLGSALDEHATGRPAASWLRGLTQHLKPNGSLVLGASNALGLRLLAGAAGPSGRPFDNFERYPFGTQERALTHRDVESLIEEAGLNCQIFGVFHQLTNPRCVISKAAWTHAPNLPRWLPVFPAGAELDGVDAFDQESMWDLLCSAGLGFELSNAWLILASRRGDHQLIPEKRFATLLRAELGGELGVRTSFVREPEGNFVYRETYDGQLSASLGHVLWTGGKEPLAPGTRLDELLIDPATRPKALLRWIETVEKGRDTRVDCVPWNILVDGETMTPVDQEIHIADYPARALVVRGLAFTVLRLARRSRYLPGTGESTVLQELRDWAAFADYKVTDEAVNDFIDHEARLQAVMSNTTPSAERRMLESILSTRLCEARTSTRVDLKLRSTHVENLQLEARLTQLTTTNATDETSTTPKPTLTWWRRVRNLGCGLPPRISAILGEKRP